MRGNNAPHKRKGADMATNAQLADMVEADRLYRIERAREESRQRGAIAYAIAQLGFGASQEAFDEIRNFWLGLNP